MGDKSGAHLRYVSFWGRARSAEGPEDWQVSKLNPPPFRP
jgi:hypothetical protein